MNHVVGELSAAPFGVRIVASSAAGVLRLATLRPAQRPLPQRIQWNQPTNTSVAALPHAALAPLQILAVI